MKTPALTLTRERSGDQGTFGRLEGAGLWLECAEPPWRDNAKNRSCIPCGEYLVRPHVSPRFGRCLHVVDVPDRTHVLIHAGNVGGDPEARVPHPYPRLFVAGHAQRTALAALLRLAARGARLAAGAASAAGVGGRTNTHPGNHNGVKE